MEILVFFICLAASTAGGICGIGGGVIIKPVLDAVCLMSVSAVSFMSGLTVLTMSMVSLFRQRRQNRVRFSIASWLAGGAIIGGVLGSRVFQFIKVWAGQDSLAGAVQAVILAVVTLLTLLYSAFFRNRLPSFHIQAAPACLLIGLAIGTLSAFLGIGGGSVNLAVLYFAFSMDAKVAGANSLYIIFCSQTASFLTSLFQNSIPDFPWNYLIWMAAAGIAGGLIGSKINQRITESTNNKLFTGVQIVIIFICIYNAHQFMSAC